MTVGFIVLPPTLIPSSIVPGLNAIPLTHAAHPFSVIGGAIFKLDWLPLFELTLRSVLFRGRWGIEFEGLLIFIGWTRPTRYWFQDGFANHFWSKRGYLFRSSLFSVFEFTLFACAAHEINNLNRD